MSRKLLILFLFLLSFHTTCCEEDETRLKKHAEEDRDFHFKYIAASTIIIITTVIRHVISEYNFPVPYSFVCLVIGILWDIAAGYSDWMFRVAKTSTKSVRGISYVFLPILSYNIGFSIDYFAFKKCLPQISIISLPVAALSAFSTGLLMRLIIGSDWSRADSILFGSFFISIFPLPVLHALKETTVHSRYIKILLEGETLLTCSWGFMVTTVVSSHIKGWVVYWYQFAMGFVRIILFGGPCGYLYGMVGTLLMKLSYNDPIGLMITTISTCFMTYYTMEWLASAGILATIIVALMMGIERSSLSPDMDKMLINLWETITAIISGILYVNIGLILPFIAAKVSYDSIVTVLVTYLTLNITRIISFCIFTPLLTKVGRISFRNLIVCMWTGLRNPICLSMALDLRHGVYLYEDRDKAHVMYVHVFLVYMLMLLINGTCEHSLLKVLGLSDLPLSRQINMDNCMKFIYEARARTIAILKMDRFLSDANWPLVMRFTGLKHPYKTQKQEIDEKEIGDHDAPGHKFSTCPECRKNVPNQPSRKEVRQMTTEAKLRLLKLKKTLYWRLYENGMISKTCIRIMHHAVELAMESEKKVVELNGLFRLFDTEGWFYRYLRNRLGYFLLPDEKFRPPRKRFRQWCYNIVNHDTFLVIMNLLVACNVATLIANFIVASNAFIIYGSHILFLLSYSAECFLKINALSWIYLYKHGVRTYFKFYRNILEFVILIVTLLGTCFHITKAMGGDSTGIFYVDIILVVLLGIRMLRLFRLLKYFVFCRTITPELIKHLESKTDRHKSIAFELGKNYIAGEEEILENLPQIVPNEKIREKLKIQIESDRLAVTRRLAFAQNESPAVASTVKTVLAMRTVLSSMKDDAYELKMSGWVEDLDYRKITKSLNERHRYISSIKMLKPPSTKLVFQEIPLMGHDERLIDFLYNHVTAIKFQKGEEARTVGEVAKNMYIVISGVFSISYSPKDTVLVRMRQTGALPVIDYVFSMTYDEPLTDFLVPGNTIGECSLLTQSPYDGTVVAETSSLVCALSQSVLKEAFKQDPDPVTGLECRMWKYMSFKKALVIMMNTPSCHSYTQEQLKYMLERGFVPDMSNYVIFAVNNMISDIILIRGVVVDFNTKEVYTAPCYVPRAVQKLVFTKEDTSVETKLMIVPAKDYNEFEIMLTAEYMGELVDEDSPKCVRQVLRDKGLPFIKTCISSRFMRSTISGFRSKLAAEAYTISSGTSSSKISVERVDSALASMAGSENTSDSQKIPDEAMAVIRLVSGTNLFPGTRYRR